MKILAEEGSLASDTILAEFARAVLLAGNGTLLINNTFVEWATVQAIRRARPSITISAFGVRNKMKPFSSLLIYADQEKSSPIPTQVDTLGTYVDLGDLLSVHLAGIREVRRVPAQYGVSICGRRRWMRRSSSRRRILAPAKIAPEKLTAAAREWMQL